MANPWHAFLSDARIGGRPPKSVGDAPRSEFHKDYDRIIFSSAFRKLSDKTQVVPFPQSDYTRQRLTHSLEVSCVGRSLATHIYNALGKEIADVRPQGDFEAIVAAACLAHDIGNPPFGHFGEQAIQDWMHERLGRFEYLELTEAQRADLTAFEGNAQSFRVLSRLQMANRPGGMQLTAATLGAVIKYPRASRVEGKSRYKKHGHVQEDSELFNSVFETIWGKSSGTGEHPRHPLAFLSEAADDICYAIIDLEDGCKAGLISWEEGIEILNGIKPLKSRPSDKPGEDRLAMGRAMAINELVQQSVAIFKDNTDKIVSGTFDGALVEHCPASDAYDVCTDIVRERVFMDERVLAMEAAGYRAIQGLLDILVPAVLAGEKRGYDGRVLVLTGIEITPEMSDYQRLLACTDYVSGMTDRHCIGLFRKLSGHADW